jgi:hypothetical protein
MLWMRELMNQGFPLIKVNAMEVHRAIYRIKSNALGLDGISLKFLKLILRFANNPTLCSTHVQYCTD